MAESDEFLAPIVEHTIDETKESVRIRHSVVFRLGRDNRPKPPLPNNQANLNPPPEKEDPWKPDETVNRDVELFEGTWMHPSYIICVLQLWLYITQDSSRLRYLV
jgi:hypothetical protein